MVVHVDLKVGVVVASVPPGKAHPESARHVAACVWNVARSVVGDVVVESVVADVVSDSIHIQVQGSEKVAVQVMDQAQGLEKALVMTSMEYSPIQSERHAPHAPIVHAAHSPRAGGGIMDVCIVRTVCIRQYIGLTNLYNLCTTGTDFRLQIFSFVREVTQVPSNGLGQHLRDVPAHLIVRGNAVGEACDLCLVFISRCW